ncbi:HAMP domain-containing sensor histidine kinase [Actinophytocola xanthii]|uniref:Signal transduction histidine-protein kinase/phosphatase MprB n=1 Tax=Actinophytocola xanthii TaxID=1912961 RepID=A0A1Q8CUC8_9PSEU|nr:HAMP domain-containing sensor histidine kinase [Actinophytocola xanthii]OLF17959.1 two-component sensor histidine kinase [Actinophytocola xanthii]
MRRRVLLLVAATTTLVLVAFLAPLALLVRNVAVDRAVQGATVEAQALTSLVATTDRQTLELAVDQVNATSDYEVTVFLDGIQLGFPAERSPLVALAEGGTSESAEVPGGREIVFAVDRPSAPAVIRSFVPDAELSAGVPRAWLLLGGLGVGLLLVSLVVADRLARTFVRSTVDLAAVSHRLGRGELEARADLSAPGELGVVAAALNGLASRIAEALREERETIADLSHRVRTPLTTLRMEAESLPEPDAERIVAGVEAVNRAVTEVIQQARRRAGAEQAVTDAAAVVRARVEFWSVLAEDTDRELTVHIQPGPLPVALGSADLEACVDALLGNVFAHTPHGTAFAVRLAAVPGGVELVVADAGPGLPAGPVLERGVSGSGSSGLGLDIVRRAAERTGGSVRLGPGPGGGLAVVVTFLAAP